MDLRPLHHDVVDSTNERAFAALEEGTAHHGDVHVARAQTAGRGRLGRTWHSAPGEGLYLSVVLLPPPPGPAHPATLTMAAGLAVLDVAHGFGVGRARLKWPNDAMVGCAKLAGILVESRGLEPSAPRFVVGVGLNVCQREFDAELTAERSVTSLTLEGVGAPLDVVEAALLGALGRRLGQALDGDVSLVTDFESALGLIGAQVRVTCGRDQRLGRLAGVDLESGVTLATPDGAQSLDLAHVTAIEDA